MVCEYHGAVPVSYTHLDVYKRQLLVEDERFAYEELKRMMQRLRPSWQLAGWAERDVYKRQLFHGAVCQVETADEFSVLYFHQI